MLTDRLHAMEETGLVERQSYQQRPQRFEYRLTPKGRALVPVLQAMCAWANRYLPDTWKAPQSFMEMTAE